MVIRSAPNGIAVIVHPIMNYVIIKLARSFFEGKVKCRNADEWYSTNV